MNEEFKYGSSKVSIDLGMIKHIDYLNTVKQTVEDPDTLIRRALISTSFSLNSFIKPGCTVVLVVSDHSRPTGSNIFVPILLKELKRLGAGNIIIVIALGLHRSSTPDEIEVILGGAVPPGVKVVNHDAENDLLDCGSASFNKAAVLADRVIVTGAVTFHPMAGFSGGRKSLLPGIASAGDIYRNHRLYFDQTGVHPGTGPANIIDNPVLKDIMERTKTFQNLWSLNVVLNEQGDMEYASCGEIDSVWDDCRKYVSIHHSVGIREKYDLVISSAGGHPSDISFYQSMKVLTNSSRACKPGGNLIIFSKCTQGWEIRDTLFPYFTMTLEEISRNLRNSFTMDGLALYMALSIIRSHTVWFCSDLPETEVTAAGMRPIRDSDVHTITAEAGNLRTIRAAVMKNCSSVLPINAKYLREHF